MTNNATPLDHSRKQKQQRKPKPATGSSKAAIAKHSDELTTGFKEIPKGYVVRNGHAITAKTIRDVGPRDMEIVQHAIAAFGHLLKPYAVQTLAGFASLIELSTPHPKARAVADTLHRLSA
ncbi:hypothetical protein [Stenotrophomonas oahuensis]|uniref:Uncharacterized protein n=1 Tax=Stenotrophomonas oahuensis TaxID=3003271 RepID=A0ABY9YVB8_9GAMM|nr:hypothetical protein [Stenotrophomonas sp. A5586]WNH54816.1 hypothetical protein PDM29_20950 [Stenotrophomonas sp. A5586]